MIFKRNDDNEIELPFIIHLLLIILSPILVIIGGIVLITVLLYCLFLSFTNIKIPDYINNLVENLLD